MRPKEIFNLAIRILGLVFLYQGLSALPSIVALLISGAILNSFMSVLVSAWPLALAWWLIGGAPAISQRAYPESDDTDSY